MLDELDAYRDAYDTLTFQQHREMYERIGEVYPEQAWFDAESVSRFIRTFSPLEVIEVGGYDGQLAAAVLPEAEYTLWWLNLELVHVKQLCDDPRYEFRLLRDWEELTGIDADALILSHTIEHLSAVRVHQLLDDLYVRAVYVEAPLNETMPTNWRGTITAHVLPWSFQEVDHQFVKRGFQVAHSAHSKGLGGGLVRWYERA